MKQDIVVAIRTLRKNRAFALTAVLTLSLGIGGSTTMFTVIHSVLLKPLGFHNPEQLVRMTNGSTIARYQELKASARSYSEIGSYLGQFGIISLAGKDGPEVVRQGRVSANFLRLLVVEPTLGRGFHAEDEAPGSSPV